MANRGLNIKVRTAWWLPIYCKLIVWGYALTGIAIDWDRVERTVARAMRVKVK